MIPIALVNHSRHVTSDELEAIAEALEIQVNDHFAPAWGSNDEVEIDCFDDASAVPSGAHQIVLFDHADHADALGYHTETPAGRPYAKVFVGPILDNGGATLSGDDANTVAATTSHELLELLGDPDCAQWVAGPAIDAGAHYALEVCDPVEAHGYDVTLEDGATQVTVSNFVLPAWFRADGQGPYDYLEVLAGPFSLAEGGYMQVRGAPGSETSVFSDDSVDEWRLAAKRHHAARGQRRRRHHHRHHHSR